jgi:hypothetical protein
MRDRDPNSFAQGFTLAVVLSLVCWLVIWRVVDLVAARQGEIS